MDRVLTRPGIGPRIFILMVAVLFSCGCGDQESAGSGTSQTQNAKRGVASGVTAHSAASAQVTDDRYNSTKDDTRPLVRIRTSLGAMDVRLDPSAAPGTVRNFLNYVQSGHYANTVFHFVETGRLILGGGYTSDGTQKPAGAPIRNEAHNGRRNKRGTLAMARAADVIDSATCQFFINLEDAPHLDHAGETPDQYGYCVFGEIVKGLDVAEQISAVPTTSQVVDGEELVVPARVVSIDAVEVVR